MATCVPQWLLRFIDVPLAVLRLPTMLFRWWRQFSQGARQSSWVTMRYILIHTYVSAYPRKLPMALTTNCCSSVDSTLYNTYHTGRLYVLYDFFGRWCDKCGYSFIHALKGFIIYMLFCSSLFALTNFILFSL